MATTATARQLLTAASAAGYGREDFSAVAKVVLALGRGRDDEPRPPAHAGAHPGGGPPRPCRAHDRELGRVLRRPGPGAARRATASWPRRSRWTGWPQAGHLTALHRTYLSINRTGLAGSVFELDDRLVASVPRAAADGWTGVKHMTRIDMDDPITASALELLGPGARAGSRQAGLEALIEPLRVAARAGSAATPTPSCWRRSSPTTWARR